MRPKWAKSIVTNFTGQNQRLALPRYPARNAFFQRYALAQKALPAFAAHGRDIQLFAAACRQQNRYLVGASLLQRCVGQLADDRLLIQRESDRLTKFVYRNRLA